MKKFRTLIQHNHRNIRTAKTNHNNVRAAKKLKVLAIHNHTDVTKEKNRKDFVRNEETKSQKIRLYKECKGSKKTESFVSETKKFPSCSVRK